MEIKFNSTFRSLLSKFNLPADLNFKIELPEDLQQKLSDNIIFNEFGLGFEMNWTPHLCGLPDEQSFHEDNENHFHVDWYLDTNTDKNVFELGVKSLIELAKRFESENISNVQLNYSFQTAEMGKIQAITIYMDDAEHLISDRLSFHTKRSGQIVVDEDMFNNEHYAFLTIDI